MNKTKNSNFIKSLFLKSVPQLGLWVPYIVLLTIGLELRTVLSYFFLVLFFLIVINSIKKRKIAQICLTLFSVLFTIVSYLEYVHWVTFGNKITDSTIHIVLETYQNEVVEFLSMYLKPAHIFTGVIFILTLIISFSYTFYSKEKPTFVRPKSNSLIKISSLVILLAVLTGFRGSILPYNALKKVLSYKKERQLLSTLPIKSTGNFKDVIHNNKNKPETYVLIIGESTTKNHMGLYNYYRQTNPLLSTRESNFFAFNNVISPHTHTIASLEKTLTFGPYENPELKYNNSIIQLFNSAKFSTFWISNQKPIGLHETSTRIISKMSKTSVFTDVSMHQLDAQVLGPFKEILNREDRKKFIVIHLMGTHANYGNRYPSDYQIFNNTPKTMFEHELAYNTINEYDNAILYNDYIVNSIISELEQKESASLLIYLSDHGEDVYETINQSCHQEEMGTEPMYSIPFLLWHSNEYQFNSKSYIFDLNRNYNIENFPYTIADLVGINFLGFDRSKSLVNPNFKPSKRDFFNGLKDDQISSKN